MRGYRSDDWFLLIDDLYRAGEAAHLEDPQRYDDLIARGRPDDICHLCLTSGTTGLPKGAMLSHRNYINMGLRLTEADPLAETDEYMSFLPFAWIGEQMNSFGVALATGITINFPESVETIMSDLKEIGPHFMFGAPRIYETIRSQIWLKIDEAKWLNRQFYNFFMKIGQQSAGYRMLGKRMPVKLGLLAWLGKTMVFGPLDQSDRAAAPAARLYRRRRAGPGVVYLLSGDRRQPEADLRADRDRRYRLYASRRRCAARYRGQTAAGHRMPHFGKGRDPVAFGFGLCRLLSKCRTKQRSCSKTAGCIRATPVTSTRTGTWW